MIGYALRCTSWLAFSPLTGIMEHFSLEGHFFFFPFPKGTSTLSSVKSNYSNHESSENLCALTAPPGWRTRFIDSSGVSSISNKTSTVVGNQHGSVQQAQVTHGREVVL